MNIIKIIHTADLHLGSPFTGGGFDEGKIRSRKKDLFDCFSRIIETAIKRKADLVIFSGDLFEEDRVKHSEVNRLAERFSEAAPIPIVILPGNHDYFRKGGYYDWLEWPINVLIFRSREFTCYEFPRLNLSVYGSAFTAPEEPERMLSSFKVTDSMKYKILVYHGSLIPTGEDINSPYRPFEERELYNLGVNYVALGHYHKPAVIKNLSGHTIASYPGSPEPLDFGEIYDHKFNVVTMEGDRIDIEQVYSASRRYLQCEVNCSSARTERDVLNLCRRATPDNAGKEDVICFLLNGYIERDLIFDKELILSELKKDFFWVRLKDETSPYYDIESISQEETTRGYYTGRMLELIAEAKETGDKDKQQRFEDALYYGLRALEGKKPEKR